MTALATPDTIRTTASRPLRRVRVDALRLVAERVLTVDLVAADDTPLPAWEPGAHVDLHLTDTLVRQYSLCSDPGEGRWRIGVLEELDGRGGSHHVHHELSVGDELLVSHPRNTIPLELGRQRTVFVAGGIGVTPILPMVRAAQEAGADWALIYLTRSAETAAFLDELGALGERVTIHHDSRDGILDLGVALDATGASDAAVFACGPGGLLAALEEYAGSRPACRLRLERFEGPGDTGPREGDTEFVVEIADGTEIEVAADESILEALDRAGVPVLSSCQEGICGTCETAVISGVPDHRDQILSEEEHESGEMMMVCVSRCLGSRLVLDL